MKKIQYVDCYDLEKGFQNLIDETGMTKYAISKEAGIDKGTIAKAEAGNNITLRNLSKIAAATNHTFKGKPDVSKLWRTMDCLVDKEKDQ